MVRFSLFVLQLLRFLKDFPNLKFHSFFRFKVFIFFDRFLGSSESPQQMSDEESKDEKRKMK
jgi:hypothetical protein